VKVTAVSEQTKEAVQMIDTLIVRVHQHVASIARNKKQSMGRSRGGLTSKIHAVVDTNGLPVQLALTASEGTIGLPANCCLSEGGNNAAG
jgi:hypothetical protein